MKSLSAAWQDQIHHRLRFCCDSFFTWIFLRSFRHHFRTFCRTEMAKKRFHSSLVKFFLDSMSESWFINSMYFICISVSKLITSNNQSTATSRNMSHCRVSSLYDHIDHCFIVFEHIQQSLLMWRLNVWGDKNWHSLHHCHSSKLLPFVNRVRWRTNVTWAHNESHCSIIFFPKAATISSHD